MLKLNGMKPCINWVEQSAQSLHGSFRRLGPKNSRYMTHRMSRILLERLPNELALQLLELLPSALWLREPAYAELYAAAASQTDLTLGYRDFVETAERSILEALPTFENPLDDQFFERVVDSFLWSVAQEIPVELKQRLANNLPTEIRSRMNLFCGMAEEAKVG